MNFPRTLARVKIMPDLRANEREFASKVYQWMDSAFARGGHPFESVSGETSVPIGKKTLFLDGAIWLNRAANLAFSNFELKTPETDVRDAELLKNAAAKARALHADYFVTWNMRDTIVWRVPHEGELLTNSLVAYDKFPSLTQITSVEDIKNKQTEILLRERALAILDLLARAKREGHFHQIDLDTTFFVGKLREATNTLAPLFAQSLGGARAHDKKFNAEIEAWRVKQGIKSGAPNENEVIARQAVYRLLAKIIFYQAMRRSHTLPAMDFAGVSPNKFQRKLAEFLAQARAIDYQAVFIEDITDRIPIPDFAAQQLQKLIADLQQYNFSQMPEDVIGTVFQELIPTEERHTLGQYFTSTNLADLVLGFCVRSPKDTVIDPTCGTGTFLVRAYDMKHKLGGFNHLQLLSQIWGVDIAAFPAELATINLFSRDISEYANFPRIVHKDFFEVKPGDKFDFPPPKPNVDPNLKITETIPSFDAAVGNFPFIRQELIEQKAKGYKRTLDQALDKDWRGKYSELFKNGETKLSGQADIYAYLFFHTAPFLKSDGRLGFITSNSWLDVDYGYELQKFFLRRFKLIAILESRCEPWFEDSSVNTVVTILERCENAAERNTNVVKFVKVKRRLAELIPQDLKLYPLERWQNVAKLVSHVESAHKQKDVGELVPGLRTFEDDDFRIRMKSQADLLEEVEAAGKTVKWGQFIRAPDIYFEILEQCKDKFTPVSEVANLKTGLYTGLNDFFYLDEDRISHWKIEKDYIVPILRSPKEVEGVLVTAKHLTGKVFVCKKTKQELRRLGHRGALAYIEWGERQVTRQKQKTAAGIPWPEVESVKNRKIGWWAIPVEKKADIFMSYVIGDRYAQRFAKKSFLSDRAFHMLTTNSDVDAEVLAAILNSAISSLFIEVSARANLGDGAIKFETEDARELLAINPRVLAKRDTSAITTTFEKIADRSVERWSNEIKQKDRMAFDQTILTALGFKSKSILHEIYSSVDEMIRERLLLAEQRKAQAKSRLERDTGKILSEVIQEILPDGARNFPEAFWPQGFNERKPNAFKEVNVTGKRLRLGHAMLMQQEVVDQDGQTISCPSRAEAEFLIYAARPDTYIVRMPADKFVIEKTVASYVRYLANLEKQFLRKIGERTLNHAEAETMTRRALETLSPFSTSD
jgi:type I restriction-modification system DNA methylase subunit